MRCTLIYNKIDVLFHRWAGVILEYMDNQLRRHPTWTRWLLKVYYYQTSTLLIHCVHHVRITYDLFIAL